MKLNITLIKVFCMQWLGKKILKDNYAWVLYNVKREAIILDCGDLTAIQDLLTAEKLNLKYILITHSHHDHTDYTQELQKATGAKVVGNKHFTDRLPPLDMEVEDGEELNLLGQQIKVYAAPGHCADHLIYHFPKLKLLFVGDVIFSLGCGKVFEGEPATMVQTLNNFKQFPQDTLIFPSHEYTKANLSFVEHLGFFHIDERKKFILENDCTLPTILEFEMKFNPFLNLNNIAFKQHVMGLETIDDVHFFTHLREMKSGLTNLMGG